MYTRCGFIKAAGIRVASLTLAGCIDELGKSGAAYQNRPNILFIMSDKKN